MNLRKDHSFSKKLVSERINPLSVEFPHEEWSKELLSSSEERKLWLLATSCGESGPLLGLYRLKFLDRSCADSSYEPPIFSSTSDCVITNKAKQLLATDTSVSTTMKNAAKRDNYCELQSSVNHRTFERTLRSRVTPLSMPLSVSSQPPRFSPF